MTQTHTSSGSERHWSTHGGHGDPFVMMGLSSFMLGKTRRSSLDASDRYGWFNIQHLSMTKAILAIKSESGK